MLGFGGLIVNRQKEIKELKRLAEELQLENRITMYPDLDAETILQEAQL
jgi:hypothetical protein